MAKFNFGDTQKTSVLKRQNLFIIAVILLGFVLRFYQLGAQSLWYDETVSAFLARLSPTELILHTARDIHPPGYYLLLHFWANAAGYSELSLAYFSAFFGVLLIPLTYLLARFLTNRTVAIWAASLVAVAPYHIWYSQEVRMYTLGAAMGLIAAYCALKAVAKPGNSRYWAGYFLAATIGLYALYYFSFLLIALNLYFLAYVLFPKIKKNALIGLIVANVLILVTYLPWLPIAWRQATNPPVPPWRSPPTFQLVATESWTALSLGQSVNASDIWPILLLTLVLFIFGLVYLDAYRSNRIRPALFLLVYTLGPLLLLYLLSFITPLYHVRYLFTYAPAFYIITGAGLAWLVTKTRPWVALAMFLVLVIASFYSIYRFHFDPQYQADDFRAAVEFIESHHQPGDVILANAGYTYTAFATYADTPTKRDRLVPYNPPQDAAAPLLLQTGAVDGDPNLGWSDPQADFYAMSRNNTIAALESVAENHPRLWQLRAYDTVTDPDGVIRNWLDQNAIPLEDQPFSGPSNIRVQGFILEVATPVEEQNIEFEDGMMLVGWEMPAHPHKSGHTIPIKLWWSATTPPGANYKMSLKLWNPDGQLAAQGQDEWPVGTLFRATDWPIGQVVYHPTQITLPDDIPPGQYWLNVELYHPDTVQPLPRLDDGSVVVTLGPVQVE